jgi:hypothetical protein
VLPAGHLPIVALGSSHLYQAHQTMRLPVWLRWGIMKIRIRAPLLSCCMILIPVTGVMQGQQARNNEEKQEPTLVETENWIHQTFGEGSHFVYGARFGISFDKLNKTDNNQCWVRLTAFNIGDQEIRFMQFANLADIDPASIRIGELIHDTDVTTVKDPGQIDYSTGAVKDHPYVFARIKTTDSAESVYDDITFVQNGKSTKHSSKENEVGFTGEGIALKPEYAPRFVKALIHAVQLCGGKPSAF